MLSLLTPLTPCDTKQKGRPRWGTALRHFLTTARLAGVRRDHSVDSVVPYLVLMAAASERAISWCAVVLG